MKKIYSILDFASLIHTHRRSFLNLIREKQIELKEGHYSKPYSLKLSNQVITFRFLNTYDSTDYEIVFSNSKKNHLSKENFIKNDFLYFFDEKLHRWLPFRIDKIYKQLDRTLEIKNQDGTYLKFEHALSSTEKELLALGKDVTVSFTRFDKHHMPIGSITKNIVADFSYFLGSNSLFLSTKKEKSLLQAQIKTEN